MLGPKQETRSREVPLRLSSLYSYLVRTYLIILLVLYQIPLMCRQGHARHRRNTILRLALWLLISIV